MRAGVMPRALALCALLGAAFGIAASPAAAGAKTLVSYEQSGGIAGTRTSLSVTLGGSARVTTSRAPGIKRFKLTLAELHALKRDLREARFSTLRSLYDSDEPIADGIAQTVRYAGYRVTVGMGARPPARLRKVLDRLSRLAARR
jgi:hypothetical protein